MNDLEYGIKYLAEINRVDYKKLNIDFKTFRGLMNITMPYNLSSKYYEVEKNIINEYLSKKTIIDVITLNEIKPNIILYKGDITVLKVDCIVNAGNSELLGCFIPNHSCVDNVIHSIAGLKARRDLIKIMDEIHTINNGEVKVTNAYNLKAKYIMHTAGPIVYGKVSQNNIDDLKKCYINSLIETSKLNLESIAFPSISTGIYSFPINEASMIAIKAVKDYLKNNKTSIKKVIFVCYSDGDYNEYDRSIKKIYK